jgi:two-component system cell cycle sensor histidine kinase/response regulator CckA
MKAPVVLVVEDEALIADDIQRTLVGLGYDVPLTVATGREAIDAATRLQPALVLMDINLYGPMDGIEAATQIRAEYSIPVVYLTSHSDDATLARAMATAPSGYLLKPFEDRELRTAIEVALHKHALESRLAERERWFSTTLQSIGDAVIATDRNETITFMNGVAETLTNWRDGAALGKRLDEVLRLVGPTGAPVESPVRLALQKSFAVALPDDTALLVRGGGQVEVDDSAAPIVDGSGTVLGGVVVFRDVTEKKVLEKRLAQSERLSSLAGMAAGMAHEINNPLATVVANVGYACDGLSALNEQMRALRVAAEQQCVLDGAVGAVADLKAALVDAAEGAERVRRIVDDLRKFARVDALPRTMLELSDVIDSAAQSAARALSPGVQLTKQYGTTPYIDANEGQLAQVFSHLLVNAAQALDDVSSVVRSIRIFTYTDAAGRAVAEVRDNGSGIPSHVLPHVFDPFFTTKPIGGGMGLGLSIAHYVVGAVGGELSVDSKPGHGTVVRVALPGARLKTEEAPTAPGDVASARRGRILVVDDEVAVARSLERILRKDHDVTVVNDGKEALAKIAAETYDVIFCDLMMPEISGMDVYASVATANPDQAARMVFMSGGTVTPRSEEFLESTTNVHISKPFLAAAVRTIANDYVR